MNQAGRETAKLVAAVRATKGWRVVETKSGYLLYPPDSSLSPVTVHRTPSDHRAVRNALSLLRQRGWTG